MDEPSTHKQQRAEGSRLQQDRKSWERRWERRVYYVFWVLAAACLALAAFAWWRFLSGAP